MATIRLLALVAAVISSARGFSMGTSAGQQCQAQALRAVARSATRTSRLVLTDPGEPKITIRAPGAAAAAAAGAAVGDGSKAKVTVRVKAPSERAAGAAAPAPIVIDDDDSMTVSSVTVKAPAKVAAPPPPPQGPELSEAERLLLSATQKANCSQVLEALQLGANPNVRDPKGRTPLHFMGGVGLAPAAVLLIHFGAQLDARDEDGLTPMHMAAGYANAQTLRVLVSAGADPNLTAKTQGKPVEVVCALGDFALKEAFASKSGLDRFKKKDEKLERLKACMDVLDDPETVRKEADWDQILTDVMKAIGGPNDSNVV